jgi:5-methylcytosine-specific restriction endonuclease McrA
MITLAKFSMGEILPLLGQGNPKAKLLTDHGEYFVKTGSPRLECLKRNQSCVCCGLAGIRWYLQTSRLGIPKKQTVCFIEECPWCQCRPPNPMLGGDTPHLNLYGLHPTHGSLVLMTQDHIRPKSRGGKDNIENLQTMCTICNRRKGNLLPDEYTTGNSSTPAVDRGSAFLERLRQIAKTSDESDNPSERAA